MKTITIRELHERTGEYIRKARRNGRDLCHRSRQNDCQDSSGARSASNSLFCPSQADPGISHAAGVHQAGNKIIPLHSVSTPGAVGKIRGIGSNTYTVIVEPAGKGFQFVFIRRLNPSAVLRFVTPAGLELERWDESALPKQFSNTVPPGARIRLPNGQIIRQ